MLNKTTFSLWLALASSVFTVNTQAQEEVVGSI
ncbi:MAG: hypothetical protein ACI82Z_001485, partial [Cellvibrionaceae bacterium]